MKHSLKNGLIWIPILTLTTFFLLSCAAKTKSPLPEEKPAPPPATKEELPKLEATPEVKQEAKPEVKPEPEPTQKQTTIAPPPPITTKPTPAPVPQVTQEPVQRTTEIALGIVNLREGPSMNHKIIRVLKKGTKLIVLEDKLGWLRVRLEEGIEGWVAKSMTLEGVRPSPAVSPKGKK
jgi:uncharacterized protein YgiM (DUF1202 family)